MAFGGGLRLLLCKTRQTARCGPSSFTKGDPARLRGTSRCALACSKVSGKGNELDEALDSPAATAIPST
jgi:hypothetical protein